MRGGHRSGAGSRIDDRFQAPRRAWLIGLLRRGIARGEVRPDADTRAVAEVLPAVLTYRIIMQREPITAADITAIMEQVLLPLIEPRRPSRARDAAKALAVDRL